MIQPHENEGSNEEEEEDQETRSSRLKALVDEMHEAWYTKLPFFMLAIFLLIGFVTCVIVGSVQLSNASANAKILAKDFNAAIASYQQNSFARIENTSFAFTSIDDETDDSFGSAMVQSQTQESEGKYRGAVSYTRRFFQFNGTLASVPPLSITLSPSSIYITDPTQIPTVSFNFTATNNTTGATNVMLVGSVPLFAVHTKKMTMSHASLRRAKCAKEGGVVKIADNTCTTFKPLTSICVKVRQRPEDQLWELDASNGGFSCRYPFSNNTGSYGTFVPTSTNMDNSTITLQYDNFTIQILSSDDPMLVLEILTQGNPEIKEYIGDESWRGFVTFMVGVGMLGGSMLLVFLVVVYHIVAKITSPSFNHSPTTKCDANANNIAFPLGSKAFLLLSGGIVFLALGLALGIPLLNHGHLSELGTFTWSAFVGVELFLFCSPLGLMFSLVFLSIAAKLWNRAAWFIFALASAVCFATAAASLGLLVRPWTTTGVDPKMYTDMLSLGIGLLMVIVAIPMGLLLAYISMRAIIVALKSNNKGGAGGGSSSSSNIRIGNRFASKPALSSLSFDDDDEEEHTEQSATFRKKERSYSARTASDISLTLLIALVLLPACFFASISLPPLWNYSLSTYRTATSPFSLIPAASSVVHFTKGYSAVLKLYPDVLAFYLFLYLLIVFSLTLFIPQFHRLMHRRLRWTKKVLNVVTFGGGEEELRLGELLLLLAVLALLVFWFWYFFWGYERTATMVFKQRFARTMGHMANVMTSLLILPVTRNSIWTVIFGVPFERAIRFHRWAGFLVFIAATMHMLSWDIEWWTQGTLIHNMFSICNIPDCDNWTIPMMEITWLCMVAMVCTSYEYFRRKHFNVFYYVHHLFIVFFVSALLHSWSLWYYLCAGLFMWVFDRLIRYSRGTVKMEVISTQYFTDKSIMLQIRSETPFIFKPGQYCFISVPSISAFQWHPFSISSPPTEGDNTFTLHIKGMGDGTWTNQLVRAVQQRTFCASSIINVDGPYGNPSLNFDKYDVIVLIGGGIGITPLHSIYMDLYAKQARAFLDHKINDSMPLLRDRGRGSRGAGSSEFSSYTYASRSFNLKRLVHLTWTVQRPAFLDMFSDMVSTIQNDDQNGVFEFSLHATRFNDYGGTTAVTSLPFTKGRPDLRGLLSRIASQNAHDLKKVAVVACGPKTLVQQVAELTFEYGLDFHSETFEL